MNFVEGLVSKVIPAVVTDFVRNYPGVVCASAAVLFVVDHLIGLALIVAF